MCAGIVNRAVMAWLYSTHLVWTQHNLTDETQELILCIFVTLTILLFVVGWGMILQVEWAVVTTSNRIICDVWTISIYNRLCVNGFLGIVFLGIVQVVWQKPHRQDDRPQTRWSSRWESSSWDDTVLITSKQCISILRHDHQARKLVTHH